MRLLLCMLLLAALPVRAELRRVAVVVGANHGALGRSSLRYSYGDADQIASVLQQVGQFDAADVHVLRDPEPQAVLDELDKQLAALRLSSGESMLVFYYSGHADATALYPDGKPLPFAQLRPRLESQAATVRIGIIDACSGGGWTGTKGLHPTAPFVVDVPLQLTGEGSVLISSSSGVEPAHESEQIEGSFFTHHLVAGLRGAADKNGDGVITLNDAFTYARERTIRDSAAVADPQHPSFSMNLRGRSDLPLTRIAQAQTVVELSETEGPLQLIHLGSGLVVMEVPAGKRTIKLSVPSGRYLVRKQRPGGNYSREVTVERDRSVTVDEADLTLSPFPSEIAKGAPDLPGVWPIAVNDRPLALHAGMTELQLNLGGARIDATTVKLSGGGGIGVSSAWVDTFSAGPALRYGVTDQLSLMLTAGALTTTCSSNVSGCGDMYYSIQANGLYLFHQGDFEVAAVAYAARGNGGGYAASGGVTGRVGRGGLVSLQLTSVLGAFSGTGPFVSISGLLLFQPFKRFSIDVGSAVATQGTLLATPGFGATLTLGSHTDLRGTVTWNGGNSTSAFGNNYYFQSASGTQLGLSMAFRP